MGSQVFYTFINTLHRDDRLGIYASSRSSFALLPRSKSDQTYGNVGLFLKAGTDGEYTQNSEIQVRTAGFNSMTPGKGVFSLFSP